RASRAWPPDDASKPRSGFGSTVSGRTEGYARVFASVRWPRPSHPLFTEVPFLCHNSTGPNPVRSFSEEASSTLIEPVPQPSDALTASTPRRRALVVEDEPHIRELVVLHLGH